MSPRVRHPLSLVIDAVFSGSLWYSKGRPPAKYTVPASPGGRSSPSSPTMWHSSSGRPTEPGWASHSSAVMNVEPMSSVPE